MNPFDQTPAQPTDPGIAAQNEWISKYMNPAFDAWIGQYQQTLNSAGFSVSKTDDNRGQTPNVYVMPSYVVFDLTKSGVTVSRAITFGVARQSDPVDQAKSDIDQIWGYQYAIQTGTNPHLPGNVLNPTPPPASSPTPAPTTPTDTSIQQQQTPPNVQSGTQSATAPAQPGTQTDTALRTWDEWNWFAEQRTGVPGPDPYILGVSDRNALLSYAEWYAIYNPWFMSRSNPSGTGDSGNTGGTGGGGNTNAALEVYNTIFAAFFALLGIGGKE